jgi:apolipoprotein N-acyltransferase
MLVTGTLLGLPFILPLLWPLAIIGVALFLVDVFTIRSWSLAGWYGWGSWTIKSLLVLSWTWTVYPIDWLPLSLGRYELGIVGVYWFTGALWLGLGGAVVSVLLKLLTARSAWLVPAVWLIAEIAGSVLFSLFTYGAGGVISGALSFGYLGYALAESNGLFWFAYAGGVYGLSIVGAAFGYGVWQLWQHWPTYRWVLLGGTSVLLWATMMIPLPRFDVPTSTTTVALVDTQLSWSVYDIENTPERHRAVLREAVAAAVEAETDFILLPEESRFFTANETLPAQVAAWRFLSGNPDTVLIDSGAVMSADGTSLVRASVVAGRTGKVAVADKGYLVPQGEYIPILYRTLLQWFGGTAVISAIEPLMNFRPGSASQVHFTDNVPAILFCFESIDPFAVRARLTERPLAPFVVHPVAHGWFHTPTTLWHQLDTMLRIQAAWNRVAIVSAGNQVTGALYTPDGRVMYPAVTSAGDSWQVKVVTVPLR